ncbi:hypothetical protein [Amaricoccus sp. W119]|uniref:hypothetical protein n=1 Tax=Amaricoccus sp. W119 TaxID=3391833 RepID=UPI0039A54D82
MLFHPRNRLSATDAALVAAHIEANGVTICPPSTYSLDAETSEMMAEARRVAEARRRACAVSNANRAAAATIRRREALPMFRDGATLETVASALGISTTQARADKKRLKAEGQL